MANKCDKCFYETDWDIDGSTFPICERDYTVSFEEARYVCEKSGPCKYYISIEDGMRIAEAFDG